LGALVTLPKIEPGALTTKKSRFTEGQIVNILGVSLPERTMDMSSRFYWLIVILILASIAMGACTAPPTPAATLPPKSTAPAPTATPAPKPMATGPGGFPVGTYKPDHKLYASSILFNAQGTFVFVLGDADTGTYTVSGDQIVFNTADGFCFNKPGTYHWEIHGNTLLLKPINETCKESSRSDDLGGRSWILQP
jgi:hypothetical protein